MLYQNLLIDAYPSMQTTTVASRLVDRLRDSSFCKVEIFLFHCIRTGIHAAMHLLAIDSVCTLLGDRAFFVYVLYDKGAWLAPSLYNACILLVAWAGEKFHEYRYCNENLPCDQNFTPANSKLATSV